MKEWLEAQTKSERYVKQRNEIRMYHGWNAMQMIRFLPTDIGSIFFKCTPLCTIKESDVQIFWNNKKRTYRNT